MKKLVTAVMLVALATTSAFGQSAVDSSCNFGENGSNASAATDLIAKIIADDASAAATVSTAGIDSIKAEIATRVAELGGGAAAQAQAEQEAASVIAIAVSAPATAGLAGAANATTAVVGGVTQGISGAGMGLGGGLAMNSTKFMTVEGMAAVAASGYCGWEIWGMPFGTWSRLDNKLVNGVVEYEGFKADTYGVNLGVSKLLSFGKVGLFTGYAHTELDGRITPFTFDMNSWTLGIYGDFQVNNFLITAIGGHTWNRYHDYRFLSLLEPVTADNHNGNAWFSSLKFGYDFQLTNCFSVIPSIGWDHTHSRTKAWNARNAAGVILHSQEKASLTSNEIPFMLRLAYNGNFGKAYVEGGYIREASSKVPTSTFSAWWTAGDTVGHGRSMSNDMGKFGAGFEGEAGRFTYGFDYGYKFDTRGLDSHNLGLKVGVKF